MFKVLGAIGAVVVAFCAPDIVASFGAVGPWPTLVTTVAAFVLFVSIGALIDGGRGRRRSGGAHHRTQTGGESH